MVSPREGYSDGLLGPRFPCPCRFHRAARSEEHTSELQSRSDLVCRLLLEKKKKIRLLSIPINPSGDCLASMSETPAPTRAASATNHVLAMRSTRLARGLACRTTRLPAWPD